jgi:hypothetical protein
MRNQRSKRQVEKLAGWFETVPEPVGGTLRNPTIAAYGFHVPPEPQKCGRNDQQVDGYVVEIKVKKMKMGLEQEIQLYRCFGYSLMRQFCFRQYDKSSHDINLNRKSG